MSRCFCSGPGHSSECPEGRAERLRDARELLRTETDFAGPTSGAVIDDLRARCARAEVELAACRALPGYRLIPGNAPGTWKASAGGPCSHGADCEQCPDTMTGHGWYGPDRTSIADAVADAWAHLSRERDYSDGT